MRKLFALLAVLALATLGFAACGGDDDGGVAEPDTEAVEEEVTSATAELKVSAPADGSLEFDQDSLETEAGTVTAQFENPAPLAHDFCIEQDGEDLGCTSLIADGDTTTEDFELEPGEYTYYCSVAGHREGGMEGTLTVE